MINDTEFGSEVLEGNILAIPICKYFIQLLEEPSYVLNPVHVAMDMHSIYKPQYNHRFINPSS